jgi:hypothetical protein
MRMLDWPVKFSKSVGESEEVRERRGVWSASLVELLRDRRCNGLCDAPGVLKMTELRSCFEGDQGSWRDLVGELRRLAKRVRSGGMAEMLLRSPTVSSKPVLSPKSRVKSISSLACASVVLEWLFWSKIC